MWNEALLRVLGNNVKNEELVIIPQRLVLGADIDAALDKFKLLPTKPCE